MKIVLALYPDYAAIAEKLPNRTLPQIRQFAQGCNLVPKRHVWTVPEERRLREAVRCRQQPQAIFALFPDLRPRQVRAKAEHLRLRWPVPAFVPSGIAIVDSVRIEARRRNLTNGDLNELCGLAPHGYWNHSTKAKPVWRHIERVVAYLGGTIDATFPSEEE